MTIITVTTPEKRLSLAQRGRLAETLTDAVLEPEVGQFAPAARAGFQVHFRELPADCMAIGGKLLAELGASFAVCSREWRKLSICRSRHRPGG